MKKFRQILLNTAIYFVYFTLSCLLVMLVEALLLKAVDRFVVLSYFAQTVIRLTVYSLGVPALVGAAGYLEGYREAERRIGVTLTSGILATLVLHLLYALLFHFRQFCAGGVPFVVGLLRDGTALTPDSIVFNDIRTAGLFIGVFIGYGLLYTAVLIGTRCIGVRRRHAQRADMGFAPDGKTRTGETAGTDDTATH